jgi:hypothetical protein
MRYEQVALALGLLTTLSTACKKDEASNPPSVTIVSPTHGSTLSVPDTLRVTADVNGHSLVEHVTFSVLDGDGIPVVPAAVVSPTTNPATITMEIPLTSDHLAGGTMTLQVKANDDGAEGKDYRTFTLMPSPLRLRAVYVIGASGPNAVTIHRLDSVGQMSLLNTVVTDLGGAAVSSWDQRMFVAGRADGPLLAFAPDGITVPWLWANMGNGMDYFTSVDLCSDGRLYVGTTNDRVTGKDPGTGSNEIVIDLQPDWRCDRCITVGSYLLCATHHMATQALRFTVYLRVSGAFHSTIATEIQAIAFFRRDDDHVLVFGNRNGSSVVMDLSIGGGGGWEPRTWPALVNAVEQMDANTFVVALADGTLERFTYSNASSIPIAAGTAFVDLSLDPVNDVLYGTTANELQALDPQTGQLMQAYPLSSEAKHILPLFNR